MSSSNFSADRSGSLVDGLSLSAFSLLDVGEISAKSQRRPSLQHNDTIQQHFYLTILYNKWLEYKITNAEVLWRVNEDKQIQSSVTTIHTIKHKKWTSGIFTTMQTQCQLKNQPINRRRWSQFQQWLQSSVKTQLCWRKLRLKTIPSLDTRRLRRSEKIFRAFIGVVARLGVLVTFRRQRLMHVYQANTTAAACNSPKTTTVDLLK